jgi:hypothetical protein
MPRFIFGYRRVVKVANIWRPTMLFRKLECSVKAKAVSLHATEESGRRGASTHSRSRQKIGVIDQRYALTALYPQGKGPLVPIVQEAGWASEPVWTQRLEEKSFRLCRESNLDHPAVQPVARHYTDWATQLKEHNFSVWPRAQDVLLCYIRLLPSSSIYRIVLPRKQFCCCWVNDNVGETCSKWHFNTSITTSQVSVRVQSAVKGWEHL